MNLEELLGKELYEQVTSKLGDKKIMIDEGQFIPKSRFDEINNQKKELKEQVDTLNKTISENAKTLESLKKSADSSDEMKKQIQEYQDKLNNVQTEFKTQLESQEKEWTKKEIEGRKTFSIREKLLLENADPKYIDLLMKEVDLDKITEQDGKFIGIDDVVSGVKTNFEKLFGKPVTTGTGVNNGGNVSQNQNIAELEQKARSGDRNARMELLKAQRATQEE